MRKPENEWQRIENTHEAIVSRDVFEQVQEQIANRRRKMKDGTRQIFAGLVKCADCGWSMAYALKTQSKTPYGIYRCSKYGQGTGHCTPHYIRYDVLYTYVLARVRYWAKQAEIDEDALLQRLLKTGDKEPLAASKKQTNELTKAEKRKAEVDRLFAKMYEDWAAGRISEYNFNMLSQKYQSEQQSLTEQIEALKSQLTVQEQSTADAEKWVKLIRRYTDPTELTAELLNTLIEKILIHEAVKQPDGTREQEVEIFYRFVGKID